jgi:hypothetical protein
LPLRAVVHSADRSHAVLPSTSRITASVANDAVNHATIPSAIPF